MAGRKQVSGSARSTIDHDEIREWVEAHGGQPAMVKRTRGKQPGILRIDFPGYSGTESLEPISWHEFFEKFEESQLAFLLQDRTGAGRPSNFNKLVARETVEIGRQNAKRGAPRSRAGTRGTSARGASVQGTNAQNTSSRSAGSRRASPPKRKRRAPANAQKKARRTKKRSSRR